MSGGTAKRLFDIVGASAGLVAFGPIVAVVAVAVLLDDGGPVIFRQVRVGFRRRPFRILKFRSMRDGRVSRVGRLLRATGLDEIPQFINILRGDMSAVGPRPLAETDVQRLGWDGPDVDFRWEARPGLTGLAQIAGARSADVALELDRAYLRRWDPLLDAELIALSFAVNVLGKTRLQRMLQGTRFAAGGGGSPSPG